MQSMIQHCDLIISGFESMHRYETCSGINRKHEGCDLCNSTQTTRYRTLSVEITLPVDEVIALLTADEDRIFLTYIYRCR